MQQGSVIREHRKLGPDVWCYRWWESGPSGNRVHRRIVLGTAEQLRDMVSARQMTAGLVQEINASDIRMTGKFMTLAQLADHFHQRELGRSNTRLSPSTKRAYQGYLGKWIVPRWEVLPELVEWKFGLNRSGRTPYLSVLTIPFLGRGTHSPTSEFGLGVQGRALAAAVFPANL